jgi:ubiquinone/menaquinone biosynthesis C-methylase UbiE
MATSHSSQQPGGEQQLFSQMGFPEIYEQALVGPLFRPWVDSLLKDVQLGPGDRVLDIACGTGIAAPSSYGSTRMKRDLPASSVRMWS